MIKENSIPTCWAGPLSCVYTNRACSPPYEQPVSCPTLTGVICVVVTPKDNDKNKKQPPLHKINNS